MRWSTLFRHARKASRVAAFLVLSAFVFVNPSHALTGSRFGINRVNLAWLSPSEREKVLDLMSKNGVGLVRLSLTRPVKASIDALRMAHEKGLAILLEIPLNHPTFFPPGTKPRTGRGRIWDMYRLSDISPEQFRLVLVNALREVDRLGIPLVAVETGNEINWGAYNGDLEVRPEESSRTARSLAEVGDPQSIERGAAKYVQLLKIVRAELAVTTINRAAKIVSAGLSDIPLEYADRRGIDSIDPASFTALLRKYGLDEAADGYGLHLYPGNGGTSVSRERHMNQALSICGTAPAQKPCWITEWGFANNSTACPSDDQLRESLVARSRHMLEEQMAAGRVSAAFYFDWDASSYGVWRCGELSPAGKAAIAP